MKNYPFWLAVGLYLLFGGMVLARIAFDMPAATADYQNCREVLIPGQFRTGGSVALTATACQRAGKWMLANE